MQPDTHEWTGGEWYVRPMEPRSGRYQGVLRRVRTRTSAGCCFFPGEEESYPWVPALDIDGALAPLKEAPADAARCLAETAAWQPREGYIGYGPPFVREHDPWLETSLAEGAVVTVLGFWHPMFHAGTYQGFQIWGLYVEQLA